LEETSLSDLGVKTASLLEAKESLLIKENLSPLSTFSNASVYPSNDICIKGKQL
jgi:hypothetical protein